MANKFYINNIRIPLASDYKERYFPQYRKLTSLRGRDRYQVLYNKRGWDISWRYIRTQNDLELIKNFWFTQLSSNSLPLLTIEGTDIVDVPVWLDISDIQRVFNNVWAASFSLTLTERDPI